MTVSELIAELEKLDPNEKIYHTDNESGPEPIDRLVQRELFPFGKAQPVWSVE